MSAPVTLLDAIGEIVRPALLRTGPIQLEETGDKSTCAPITLNKAGRAVVVKPDADARLACPTCRAPLTSAVGDRIFGLFNNRVPELTAICDYIIFYQEKEGAEPPLFVFLCELKSNNITGAGKQAENGKLLADLILAMARHHRSVRLPNRICYRGLIFSTKYTPVPKGRLLTTRCTFEANNPRMPEMGFAYFPCGGSYPLNHFCA